MATKDIVVNNIKKQLALNSGQINVRNADGSYGFYDAAGKQVKSGQDASNYIMANTPAIYQSNLRTEVYNYAKGVFGGQNVPNELVESLASLATYYVSQTGTSVQTLFKQGQLQSQFLATINAFLNKSLQFGYQSLNSNQPWVNNPTLHGNIAAAYQPSVR